MRRSFSVLIVAVVVLALAGCGGGGGGQAAAPTAPPPAAPAPAPAPATVVPDKVADRSANTSPTFERFPSGTFVPDDLKAGIDAKRPTLILFTDNSYLSKTTRGIIDEVRTEDRGVIDLVVYDLSRYVTTSPTGQITVDSTLTADPSAQQVVLLARTLGVTSVPYVVITDVQGYIIWKYRGLVDKAFLTREVRRATQ